MTRKAPCGKQIYKTRRTILRVLERLKVGDTRQEARAYYCRRCNGWHLTSQL